MIVKDFMIKDVITINKETSIKELLELLVQYKINGLPVVDSNGKLLGMVSDGDILRYLSSKNETHVHALGFMHYAEQENVEKSIKGELSKQIKIIMKKKILITLSPSDDIKTVLKILSKHRYKNIPVVDKEKKIVGIVSRGDVIRMLSQDIISNYS